MKNDVTLFGWDGNNNDVLLFPDVVRIRKHPVRLSIIRPHGSSYFDALRNKLGWTGDRDLRSGIRT